MFAVHYAKSRLYDADHDIANYFLFITLVPGLNFMLCSGNPTNQVVLKPLGGRHKSSVKFIAERANKVREELSLSVSGFIPARGMNISINVSLINR